MIFIYKGIGVVPSGGCLSGSAFFVPICPSLALSLSTGSMELLNGMKVQDVS